MSNIPIDSIRRFTDRVTDYIRCRPGYPEALHDTIVEAARLSPSSVIADIGSGTGMSAAAFLRRGFTVFAVEPNDAMRRSAEDQFRADPLFHSIKGQAEDTTLPSASVDLISAGQAFHWFDPARARSEFQRVLRANGHVALFWNERSAEADAFAGEYETLLQTFGTDYDRTQHRNIGIDRIETFFGGDFQTFTFPNEQVLDFEGLRGRLLSASYAPAPGHPQYEPMLAKLRALFDEYQKDGYIRLGYETKLYLGTLPL